MKDGSNERLVTMADAARVDAAPATAMDEARPGTRIVVNGRPCTVSGGEIGQAALARAAFPLVGRSTARSLTVAFTRGPTTRPEGFVAPGETVEVTKGQDFVVVVADQS